VSCDHCGSKFESLQSLDKHIQTSHKKKPEVVCEHCESKFSSLDNLNKHLSYRHRIYPQKDIPQSSSKWSRTYSYSERSSNGFCRYWNNSRCQFQDQCKFLHEEAPFCRFQEKCNRIKTCHFFHEVKKSQGFQFREEEFPPYQTNPGRRQ
jgi:DNA-directed RNA polymerase subunit RPC12/RpoP